MADDGALQTTFGNLIGATRFRAIKHALSALSAGRWRIPTVAVLIAARSRWG